MNAMDTSSVATEQETVNIPPAMHHDPVSARQELKAWEEMHREEKHELAVWHNHVYALGRMLLGAIFLVMAWEKLRHFGVSTDSMYSMGFSDAPILIAAAAAVEVVGGAALVSGYKVRAAAVGLIGYLATVTLLVSWDVSVALNRALVLANVGCIAALLLMAGHGAGSWSLDRRQAHRRRAAVS